MSGPSSVIAIVPAAGQSSRFGSAKLLASIDGICLIDRTIGCLLDAGLERIVVVAGRRDALDAARLVHDARVSVVVNVEPSRGMFSSIQTGVAAENGNAYLVLPADMPFVRAVTVGAVLDHARAADSVVVPVFRGRRGHPILVPVGLRAHMLAADPSSTLKDVLLASAAPQIEIDVDDPGITRDVDVPNDLIADPPE
ncbi:MAG TPA: nucleotidyltransferase family protein [Vicinamibacterales bacterium]|jgi:molybdenum cofactor cytidylyltransferase|nr:nucleotidyltransferase family protein [Vicinamibacterales bacterium]